ncbi:type II toxin-antitoxin system VapC family toxin [Mucilaginibacter glaciei]|uniref:Type II toxin-antitoxin system VapC family toxin n=1 Tax=Mucilaginibacter glaciei TaxID=2772109 RepID=A0A926NIL7_9SPHI|nr:type II toxin-antitoxin system VapC family toxin [Mucilaginibacter glaciei]MBD1392774.1 type II toxin-antitoxin system VapC family toxin [Mucilaginibacter glaciei]
MKSVYLWDTNTVIYFLQHQFSALAEQKIDELVKTNAAVISVITEIELLSWRSSNEEDIITIKTFLWSSYIYPLDNDVKQKTIEIRKQFKLKLPDAIIAATALVYGKTLITRNVSDFGKIPGIKLLNPFAD